MNLVLWKPERALFRSIKTAEQLKAFVNDEHARLKFVRKYLVQSDCPAAIISMIESCLRGKYERKTDKCRKKSFLMLFSVRICVRRFRVS